MEKLIDLRVRVTEEQKTYLTEMAWRNRTSLKDYVQQLIAADMVKNPDWTKDLDELNSEKPKTVDQLQKNLKKQTEEFKELYEIIMNEGKNDAAAVALPEDIKQEMGKQLIEINKLLKGK